MLVMSVGEQFLYLLLGRRTLGLEKCMTKGQSQALLSVGLHEPWLSVQLYFRHTVTVIISVKLRLKAGTCVKKESTALSCLSLSLPVNLLKQICCCAECVRLSNCSSSAYLPTFEIYK